MVPQTEADFSFWESCSNGEQLHCVKWDWHGTEKQASGVDKSWENLTVDLYIIAVHDVYKCTKQKHRATCTYWSQISSTLYS